MNKKIGMEIQAGTSPTPTLNPSKKLSATSQRPVPDPKMFPMFATDPPTVAKTKTSFLKLFEGPILWPMYLHGETGTGKTYAACVVYQHWPKMMKLGMIRNPSEGPFYIDGEFEVDSPMFLDCQNACAMLAMLRANDYSEARTWLRQFGDAELVVLDEVGRRSMTEPQLDALKDMIDRRGQKPMILTSNKTPAELTKVLCDQRIVDRIQGTVVELTGTSKRSAKTKRIKL